MKKIRARLSLDFNYDKDENFEIMNSLRALGFRVSATAVSGIQPDLWIGSDNYHGIDEIEKFIAEEQEKKIKGGKRKMEKARLCLDFNYDKDENFEIIDSLRALGLFVTTIPVSGIQPELSVGSRNYYGIDAIEKFIEQEREKNKRE